MPWNRNKTQRVLVLASAAAALVVSALFAMSYANSRPIAFEKTRWLQAREEENWHLRSAMATDLISRNAIIGQTHDQVIALLGEPEKYSDSSSQELYYLVREDWDMIDPIRRDHLLVFTDQAGRTVAAKITIFQRQRP